MLKHNTAPWHGPRSLCSTREPGVEWWENSPLRNWSKCCCYCPPPHCQRCPLCTGILLPLANDYTTMRGLWEVNGGRLHCWAIGQAERLPGEFPPTSYPLSSLPSTPNNMLRKSSCTSSWDSVAVHLFTLAVRGHQESKQQVQMRLCLIDSRTIMVRGRQ